MSKDDNRQKTAADKNLLEWLVFGVSCLLTLCVIGYLTYKTITHQPSPPNIGVKYELDPTENAPYRYHFTIKNKGGETAEEVIIEMLLQKNDSIIEKSQVHIPFAPKASKRESWVTFSHDPSLADTLVVRVASFSRP